MSTMLDIIVTHYNEPWETGKKLFTMLDLQRGIDFARIGVILVNDGEEHRLPDACFEGRPYRVTQISIPHAGVSAARNAGLKASAAEWVAFCDFDDTYTNIYSLKTILDVLPAPDYDMLKGDLIAEDFMDGKASLTMSPDIACMVFLHGKFYRRQFLLRHDIWFDEELTFNEDSAFNAIINTCIDYTRIGNFKSFTPLYAWCRRPKSVTSTPGSTDAATWGHYRRNLKVCEATRLRMPLDHLLGMVTRTCVDTYFMCKSRRVSEAMKQRIREDFIPFWEKHKPFYGVENPGTMAQIIDIARKELSEGDEDIPCDDAAVRAWLSEIERKEG